VSHFQIMLFFIILVVLIAISAFFSSAETALMVVNRYRLRHKARIKRRYAMLILTLLKRPDRLLGVILIGNTCANIFASSVATILAYTLWGEQGAFLAIVLLTLFILIFAEIMPKTVAAIYSDQVSRFVIYPVKFILTVFYPVVWLANGVSNGLLHLLRLDVTQRNNEPLSREELRSVVYETKGKISREYQNMLLSILDLSKMSVEDVMIPRHEMVGIDMNLPWEDIVDKIHKIKTDWVPFYRENINQMLGVLYVRDLMKSMLASIPLNKEHLQNLLQETYFVPEGTLLSVQLSYFQQSYDKVAFVVDEYGEIQGLLTLNDILEEIVGDFSPDLVPGKRLQQQADESYLVDGAITVREFNRQTDWDLPLTGPRTVNGLIVEHLESLPHERSCVLISRYPIEIVHVRDNRIKLARIFPRLAEK
jgi:Mg2+/Co2+ transporter CorB